MTTTRLTMARRFDSRALDVMTKYDPDLRDNTVSEWRLRLLLRQRVMLAWVYPVQSGAHHGHGRQSRIECGEVGGTVDPFGHAAGDHEAGVTQGLAEGSRQGAPAQGRRAGTDDGQLRAQQQARVTGHEQRHRRLGNGVEQRREIFVGAQQQAMAGLVEPGQVGFEAAVVGAFEPAPRVRWQLGQALQQRGVHGLDPIVERQLFAKADGGEPRLRAEGAPC